MIFLLIICQLEVVNYHRKWICAYEIVVKVCWLYNMKIYVYVDLCQLCGLYALCEWCELCWWCELYELDELYALCEICVLCGHKCRWVYGYII